MQRIYRTSAFAQTPGHVSWTKIGILCYSAVARNGGCSLSALYLTFLTLNTEKYDKLCFSMNFLVYLLHSKNIYAILFLLSAKQLSLTRRLDTSKGFIQLVIKNIEYPIDFYCSDDIVLYVAKTTAIKLLFEN